jgi:hypothetical protein
MGVISTLLVARPNEAEAVLASDEPSRTWDGFSYRGLDRIKLATLWALVESNFDNDRLNDRLDQIRTIPQGDKGPWVDILPTTMLSELASIAVMEEDDQARVAELWGKTNEFRYWDRSKVIDLLRSIGDAAETAQLDGKTLLLWTSL